MLTILSREIHGFGQKKHRGPGRRAEGVIGSAQSDRRGRSDGSRAGAFSIASRRRPGEGFCREEGPTGFGTDEIFLDAGFPGDGAGRNGLSPAGERGGQGFAIQKTGDVIRQSGFTAGGGQAVFPAEGGQLFLQIIIGAEGFAIRQPVQGRSFVQGRGVLRRVSPSFSR